MDETGQIVPYIDVENSQDPYIGKEFQSLDDSFKFYLDYAHRSGFSVRQAEQATRSEKHYLFAHQRLLQLCRELDELPYESEEDCVPNDLVGEKYCEMNQVGEKDCEMKSCEQSQDVTLFDPPVVITKGRPESLRKKYALEVAQKAKKVSSQKNKKVSSQKIQQVPS
ncbi:hypothetical protein CQW23_07966 [Capsicum baccatum]|uniref:Protein FAR1-RELATED SEQUENCE n=1 Tax=Capsicum baccatum TaxID=33114 RepID=A0A2G2X7L0_CAPBA|nr:hypothetical protein CQW23_07966 [Capsicum baccatum]